MPSDPTSELEAKLSELFSVEESADSSSTDMTPELDSGSETTSSSTMVKVSEVKFD